MRTLLLLLVGVALAQQVDDAKLMDLLRQLDDAPTQADYDALGPEVGASLLAVAQDDSQSHSVRARAIVALGWYPSDEGRVWLEATLAQADGDSLYRRKSAHALATGWGVDALPALTPALASDDVQLRMATARAVGALEDPAATQLLQARLEVETEASVQKVLREQVQ